LNTKTFWWIFIGALAVYGLGFSVDIMDVDSAQYASISREMVEGGSYLEVKNNGQDYLDKPPLIFWVTSIFFQLFGYSNFTFKIGSFLFTLLGVYSTFRLGKFLYHARVGRLAAAILFTCQAFFLFNNDVRTDTILTGSIIFAIWQLVEWLHHKKWKWLLGAAVGIALAMLAKGPVGLMVPVLAISSYLVGKGRWADFFNWQYLVIIALVGVMLAPMLYGLYTQFDLQPEKSVPMITPDGYKYETGVSGLKFYLWTQSFGRITGENTWSNNSGPFFFIHNFLWSFLPWALLFAIAFFSRITQVVKISLKGEKLPELLTIGGFLLPFLALSMSEFKLPHYIFVLYPLAAVLLASWWEEGVWKYKLKGFKIAALVTQSIILLASGLALYFLYFRFFKGAPLYLPLLTGLLLAGAVYFLLKWKKSSVMLIMASVWISLAINFTLNGWFYPNLLKYQWGSEMANYIEENDIDASTVYEYYTFTYSFNFYAGRTADVVIDEIIEHKLKKGKEVHVITADPYLQDLRSDFKVHTLYTFGSHSVTLLNMKFLDPATRAQTLKPIYLVKILGKAQNNTEE
jgi:4-amino-4-deoxy-L-arabinose transferase-like glycosyltransferase